jgi:hypothetical protein
MIKVDFIPLDIQQACGHGCRAQAYRSWLRFAGRSHQNTQGQYFASKKKKTHAQSIITLFNKFDIRTHILER